MNRLAIAALCSVVWLWATTALAQKVVLLRPPRPSPSVAEVLARLHGELLSIGIEVSFTAASPASSSSAESEAIRELARDSEAEAVLEVLGDVNPQAIHVWIADSKRDYEPALVELSTDQNAPNELAIRAVEVLRSRLLEGDLTPRRSVSPPKHAAATPGTLRPKNPVPPREDERNRRLGFEIGAATLISFDRLGPAVLPLARVNWSLDAPVVLQATAAGLGTRPNVATNAGSAQVAQQYVLVGARAGFREKRSLRPFFALSAGALRTAVEGVASGAGEGHSLSQWSFLVDAGVGASLELGAHYSLSLVTEVQLAQPYVVIHFLDDAVASSGRPNLVVALAFGAWP
ncbi:MAG TPA: hypothetical protein VFQ35_16865 [Polyangiaceae bacterium]|nr:hypothetical protein [Polyangiaceae bacterium]